MSKAKLEKLIAAAYELKAWRDSGELLQNRDIENKIIMALTSEPPENARWRYKNKGNYKSIRFFRIREDGKIYTCDSEPFELHELIEIIEKVRSHFEPVEASKRCRNCHKEIVTKEQYYIHLDTGRGVCSHYAELDEGES